MGSFAGPNQNSNLNDISAEQQTTCNSGVTYPGERLGLRSKGGKCISVYKTQFHKSIQGFGISLEWELLSSILKFSKKIFFFFLLNHFYCYSIIVVPIFPPLPSSAWATSCSHSQSPHHWPCPHLFIILFFKILFIYLYLERGKGGRKRGREISMCGCLWCVPYWGPGPQPRHVPWLGIEPVTLWFTGWCSIHWATPARAVHNSLRVQRINIENVTLGSLL